jgi:hypothetical protein
VRQVVVEEQQVEVLLTLQQPQRRGPVRAGHDAEAVHLQSVPYSVGDDLAVFGV